MLAVATNAGCVEGILVWYVLSMFQKAQVGLGMFWVVNQSADVCGACGSLSS